jgi:hypothetical protein
VVRREPGEAETRGEEHGGEYRRRRDRKLAEPAAPKRLPDEPLPKAAPMSAPFPVLQQDEPADRHGDQQMQTSTNVSTIFMFHSGTAG